MPKTILVIEDEKPIQSVLKAFLVDAGYTVLLAGDGVEGLEKFHQHFPDLVLLDVLLPGIDGFAVCKTLRQESRVPIIMLKFGYIFYYKETSPPPSRRSSHTPAR